METNVFFLRLYVLSYKLCAGVKASCVAMMMVMIVIMRIVSIMIARKMTKTKKKQHLYH